jgi:hypothetical protein
MKKIIHTFAIVIFFTFQAIGQINPVLNLTWEQGYNSPDNWWILSWDEPELPHNELLGYNIYRDDELYRFQTENSLYFFDEQNNNCGNDFFDFNGNHGQFYVHVTALYNPGPVESDYTETIYIQGLVISTDDFKKEKSILYPNPTNGIVNIESEEVKRILLYDISGKIIKDIRPTQHFDISDLTKGIYIVKLITDNGISVDKIILE